MRTNKPADAKQYLFYSLFVLSLLNFSCSPSSDQTTTLQLTSDQIKAGEQIPVAHTCDGEDKSPALRWTKGPEGTVSYTVLMEDLDSPEKKWTHWILWDIPPTVTYLPPGFPPIEKLGNAERHGLNDFGKMGYAGPCPATGERRYSFKVIALDEMLRMDQGMMTPSKLEEVMRGHILSEGELTARYARKT